MQMIVVTTTELRHLLRDEINNVLAKEKTNNLSGQSEETLLKRRDIAEMFDVTLVTIHSWMNSGLLPFHRIGGRTFFKKHEVIDALKSVKIKRKL